MITRRGIILGTAGLAAGGPPAVAHHGWGSFDTSKVLDLAGAVVRSTYANPHGEVILLKDKAEVTFELAPVSRMTARGLAAADIAPGRTVRLYGYQNTRTPTLYRAEWIEVDGRRIELR